ncbi:MAG: DEAD/DEAH box helicase [Crocinitomicaceae bacterium]|nr:DEAD/DEAH box helicase [Crocinitomicaceae bacterium]
MRNTSKQLVAQLGIKELTPIQKDALEQYPSFEEVVLYSPTGSGKTLAFLLPLVELLAEKDSFSRGVQAIILSPTRELAVQIETVFKSLKTDFSITACYGGHSVKTEVNNLAAHPTVIVGTPGRISDHLNRRNLVLKGTSFFVVDEFDKCLELGFHTEIEHIIGQMNSLKKSFYGSATRIDEFPSFIRLKNPVYLDQLKKEKQPDIRFYEVFTEQDKLTTLRHLITQFNHAPTIVFCNFREDVDHIAAFCADNGMAVTRYHGGMEQDERERALIKFRNQSCPVLVCTDLGSRGLDIPEVKHIVHFQLPDKEDAFIHRNGRTARMAADGNAYVFREDYPKFDLPKLSPFELKTSLSYVLPKWNTLYFSAGKKNKINKIDVLGFICQKGKLGKEDVGVIAVLDYASYVAICSKDIDALLRELRNHKVKGQKLKIAHSN